MNDNCMIARLLLPRVIHVQCPDLWELAMSFLRFQEYYESPCPDFRGKTGWTLSEYRMWYVTQRGRWSYADDWCGFNLPGTVFKVFENGGFDPLSDREKALIGHVRRLVPSGRFYVIGSALNSRASTFAHETAHALYYLNAGYRRAMTRLVAGLPCACVEELTGFLDKTAGYSKDVYPDEIQAYAVVGRPPFPRETDAIRKSTSAMRKVFNRYAGNGPRTTDDGRLEKHCGQKTAGLQRGKVTGLQGGERSRAVGSGGRMPPTHRRGGGEKSRGVR